MATTDETVTDDYIARALTLLRGAEGEAIESSQMLKTIHESIIKDIETILVNPSRKNITEVQLIVDAKLDIFYNSEWPDELKAISSEVITKELLWNKNLLDDILKDDLVAPRSESVQIAAQKKLYQGKTFDTWVDNAFRSEASKVKRTLRVSFNEGKSIQEMIRDVKKITGRADSDVKTITRSFFMHNATESKESVFSLNKRIMQGKKWVSTLDSRTTPLICGIRDQKNYTLENVPVGHDLLWEAGPGRIHWNCRSTSVPVLKGISSTSPRPSVGAGKNYERGDNVTRTGRVRKPNKKARDDGIYEIDIKTTRTKYESWLRDQSRHNIDFVSDVLGSKAKARDFRDGKVTLFDLGAASPVSNPTNRKAI